MDKLEKVIAGLEFCGEANKSVDACLAMCPYYGERDGDKVCMDFMMEDALTVIEALRAERDDLRKDVAVLTEPPEIRTCYCPICHKHFSVRSNDSMGSCPDCGHDVVLWREVDL